MKTLTITGTGTITLIGQFAVIGDQVTVDPATGTAATPSGISGVNKTNPPPLPGTQAQPTTLPPLPGTQAQGPQPTGMPGAPVGWEDPKPFLAEAATLSLDTPDNIARWWELQQRALQKHPAPEQVHTVKAVAWMFLGDTAKESYWPRLSRAQQEQVALKYIEQKLQ